MQVKLIARKVLLVPAISKVLHKHTHTKRLDSPESAFLAYVARLLYFFGVHWQFSEWISSAVERGCKATTCHVYPAGIHYARSWHPQ